MSKILLVNSVNFNDLFVPNYSSDILANFKYALITSVDIECNFSSYKYIFTDLCYSFTKVNMELFIDLTYQLHKMCRIFFLLCTNIYYLSISMYI
jgi:hypothetical protein